MSVTETQTLAERFEAHRDHLRAVAHRVLGSAVEADDAVQEAWLRVSRADAGGVDNLRGWLTTVVARICLDMLRSRKSRREDSLDGDEREAAAAGRPEDTLPDRELWLADSVGLALLVVLETLAPAERIAFVLHDLFDLPFDEIAPIVERSPDATRQLASRARRRVRGASAISDGDRTRQREIVQAFLAASRDGDYGALLDALDPQVVLRADRAAVAAAAARASAGAPLLSAELRGARAVADSFKGRARAARPALIGGLAGAVWAPNGTPRTVFVFTVALGANGKAGETDKIVAIDIVMDPARVRELDVEMMPSA